MAEIKISELPSLLTMTDAAEIPVVASGTTQQITGANLKPYFTANVGFDGDRIYDLNGLAVNNSDLSHGATAGINVPANGLGTVEVFNSYGDVNIIAGDWSVFKVYNRALSAAEVTQNFNALRGRYGV